MRGWRRSMSGNVKALALMLSYCPCSDDNAASYTRVRPNETRRDDEIWNDVGIICGGSGEFHVLLAAGLPVGSPRLTSDEVDGHRGFDLDACSN